MPYDESKNKQSQLSELVSAIWMADWSFKSPLYMLVSQIWASKPEAMQEANNYRVP